MAAVHLGMLFVDLILVFPVAGFWIRIRRWDMQKNGSPRFSERKPSCRIGDGSKPLKAQSQMSRAVASVWVSVTLTNTIRTAIDVESRFTSQLVPHGSSSVLGPAVVTVCGRKTLGMRNAVRVLDSNQLKVKIHLVFALFRLL